MRAEQTVDEMVEEILSRQARAIAQQTGEPFAQALAAVLETPAGHQLILCSALMVMCGTITSSPQCCPY